jgi:hypothetical protein
MKFMKEMIYNCVYCPFEVNKGLNKECLKLENVMTMYTAYT